MNRCSHRWHSNTRSGSRRNIHAHYDLGNEFFRLWLDDMLAYSCGLFPTPESSLREASLGKFDRVCRRLDLQPQDHLLEIGSGWGGLALHAASQFGCRVTTTTISQAQYDLARQRIAAAGLSQLVTVLLQDYRDLEGKYDELVSIEMIEAVGFQYLDTYFGKCSELLQPGGSFMLQAIVLPERDYDNYLLRQITNQLGLPGASVLEITRTLVKLGYLSCEAVTKRHFSTNRFLLLGQPSLPSRGLTEYALGAMRQIRPVTGGAREGGAAHKFSGRAIAAIQLWRRAIRQQRQKFVRACP